MFKVGDLVRRKEQFRGAPLWIHGGAPYTVRAVKDELVLTSAEDAWKVASRFESAAPQPLWRDRLFADLRAAGASHAAATEFVAVSRDAADIRHIYEVFPDQLVDALASWSTTSQGGAYWSRIHYAHMARCKVQA